MLAEKNPVNEVLTNMKETKEPDKKKKQGII